MSTSTSQDLRCPRCAAHLRAGADWCSLCYTDLRPTPEPSDAPAPVVAPGPHDLVVPPAVAEQHAPAPRGKHARVASEPTIDPALTPEAMLAQLAAAESGHPLGHLAGRVDTPGKKVALMAGGAVALTVLLFVLMVVVGALL